MKFRKVKLEICRWVPEGEVVPWYLGHAYRDFASNRRMAVVVPLNFLVRWWEWVRWKWDRLRFAHGWIDEHVRRQVENLETEKARLEQLVGDFQASALIDVGNVGGPCCVEPRHVEKHVTELRAREEQLERDNRKLEKEKAEALLALSIARTDWDHGRAVMNSRFAALATENARLRERLGERENVSE